MPAMPRTPDQQRQFLQARNRLWANLRALEADDPAFAPALAELMRLTHWSAAQVLAGLGLGAASEHVTEPSDPARR
jgi:hypothetical protein